jgi:hypothetical protein
MSRHFVSQRGVTPILVALERAHTSHDHSMRNVNTTVTKFFIWETGYFNTIDIMHDRAGYYICWGCLVWLPCVYTCPSMYLTNHPVTLVSDVTVQRRAAPCNAV